MTTYFKWEKRGKSVRAHGGKENEYIHYCPFEDFEQITKVLFFIFEKEGIVSTLDVFDYVDGAELSGDRIFRSDSHGYKVKMVFDILLQENIIKRKGIKKYYQGKGRNPYGYVFTISNNELENWLDKLVNNTNPKDTENIKSISSIRINEEEVYRDG